MKVKFSRKQAYQGRFSLKNVSLKQRERALGTPLAWTDLDAAEDLFVTKGKIGMIFFSRESGEHGEHLCPFSNQGRTKSTRDIK